MALASNPSLARRVQRAARVLAWCALAIALPIAAALAAHLLLGSAGREVARHDTAIRHLVASRDGTLIAAADGTGRVDVLDAATGRRLMTRAPNGERVLAVAVGWHRELRRTRTEIGGSDPLGENLFADGLFVLTPRAIERYREDNAWRRELALLADAPQFARVTEEIRTAGIEIVLNQPSLLGGYYCVGSGRCSVINGAAQSQAIDEMPTAVAGLGFSIVLGTRAGAVVVESRPGASWSPAAITAPHRGPVVALATGSGRLVSFGADGEVFLWSLGDGRSIVPLPAPDRRLASGDGAGAACPRCEALAISPDGRLVLAGGAGGATLWSADDGRVIARLDHGAHVHAVALDDTTAATAGGDGRVRLWRIAEVVEPVEPVDSTRTSTNTAEARVRRRHIVNDTPTADIHGHAAAITHMLLLPGGRLVTGGLDGRVRLAHVSSAVSTALLDERRLMGLLGTWGSGGEPPDDVDVSLGMYRVAVLANYFDLTRPSTLWSVSGVLIREPNLVLTARILDRDGNELLTDRSRVWVCEQEAAPIDASAGDRNARVAEEIEALQRRANALADGSAPGTQLQKAEERVASLRSELGVLQSCAEASVRKIDQGRSVVLLESPDRLSGRAPRFSIEDVEVGSSVRAYGFPTNADRADDAAAPRERERRRLVPAITSGAVVRVQVDPSGGHAILHSAPVPSGGIGGPLVNPCGEVVGLNRGEPPAGVASAIGARELVTFAELNGLTLRVSTRPCSSRLGPEPARPKAAPVPQIEPVRPPSPTPREPTRPPITVPLL